MTLRITSPTSPSDPTFQRLLAAIPAGTQWVRGNIIPYTTLDGVPALLHATPGENVDIYLNGKLVQSIIPDTPTYVIHLGLRQGSNTIIAKQGLDTFQTLMVATEYAIYLRAFGDETYASIERRIEEFEQHLRSFFSVRLTEHQTAFVDMLPSSLAYRTLLAKLGVRALINESSMTRGVDDLVTAVTVSNPYTNEQIASYDPNKPVFYSDGQDFGGHTFHVWLPNTCLASWYGFTRLVDTFQDDVHLDLVSATDARVVVTHEGTTSQHVFDTLVADCFDLEDPCALESHIWVRITSSLVLWLCAWSTPFDAAVDLPLGRRRFDENLPFDSGIPLDSMDPTAPMDGWVGTSISRRFDEPSCLDSTVGGASSTAEEDLCCTQPADGLLVETLVDFSVPAISHISATLTVLPP